MRLTLRAIWVHHHDGYSSWFDEALGEFDFGMKVRFCPSNYAMRLYAPLFSQRYYQAT
jgi:hypothetical protein